MEISSLVGLKKNNNYENQWSNPSLTNISLSEFFLMQSNNLIIKVYESVSTLQATSSPNKHKSLNYYFTASVK